MKARIIARAVLGITLLLVLASSLPGSARPPGRLVDPVPQPMMYLPVLLKPEPVPPLPSTSLYITTQNLTTLYNEGCKLGQRDYNTEDKQDSVVVLHFGYPRLSNGQYGTRLYSPATPATVDQIAVMVEQFGYGYWYCVYKDFDSHLRIAIGTSNYPGMDLTAAELTGHGRAWAQMVNRVNDWFQNNCTRGCDGQVDAVGASDIELSWNDYAATKAWLDGYDAANSYPLYNFGAIPGCPYLRSTGSTCGGGGYTWTKEQVWYVTWGASPVQPLPEIYRTDGVNAEQWYLMSVYSYQAHRAKMQFVGPMSQYQACLQRGGCNTIDNTPQQAWRQLYDLLNRNIVTAGEALPYLTDIMWLGEALPSSTEPAAGDATALIIQDLKTAVQNDRLGAQERKSLEEKLQQNERLAAARSAAKPAQPETKQLAQALLPPAQQVPLPPVADQIIPGSEGILRTWEANIQNLWQGQRDGWFYQVLAGSSAEDAGQGLVLVIQSRPDGSSYSQKFFYAPGKTGALRVIEVQGTRLALSTASGARLIFDLTTRSFETE